MNITGKITGIKYKVSLAKELPTFNIGDFDVNNFPPAFIINDGRNSFAVSKWVSPKRTRSYPYERVYHTLNISKKITIIPVVKDEGKAGDRDFLQWDSVSLMSLLDVYVILAYYTSATRNGKKIKRQQFDTAYILSKIKEIKQYHSSSLHWNLNELKTNLHRVIDKTKSSYQQMEKLMGIQFHGVSGLDNFKNKIGEDVSLFMKFSRGKSEKAQAREYVTVQPKENLSTKTKAKITITNYLGGQYFFTVDEVKHTKDNLQLIEKKHSKKGLLPAKGDIIDGVLKMILFSNLTNTKADEKKVNCMAVLELTSLKLKGEINSNSSESSIKRFFKSNAFSKSRTEFLIKLFKEASANNFTVSIKQVK